MADVARTELRLRKQEWRALLLAGRRERSAAERSAARSANGAWLAAELADCATVCAYLPLATEPFDPALITGLADTGCRVLLPVATTGRPLDWCVFVPGSVGDVGAAGDGVRRSAFGIDEPAGPLLGSDAVHDADAVCVPALAVDHDGVRLGHGGGHYDRTLAQLDPARQVRLIAVVFDDEVVASLPVGGHDQRVNALVTPSSGVLALPLEQDHVARAGRRPASSN